MKSAPNFLLFIAICGIFWAYCPMAQGDTRTIRVLCYNIHAGVGVDEQLDLGRIAAVINESNADLVALQEVDRNTRRSGTVDQPAALGALTGMYHAFGKNIPREGGEYGNAVLSRFPIDCYRNYLLPRRDLSQEQRGLLEVKVRVDGQPLPFYSTHFHHKTSEPQARLDAVPVVRCVLSRLGQPAILAGDLNARPHKEEILRMMGYLSDSFQTNPGGDFTVPVDVPEKRIDYILHNRDSRLSYVDNSYLIIRQPNPANEPSDHLPIYAEYELTIGGGGNYCPPNPPIAHVDKYRTGIQVGTPEHAYHTVGNAVTLASAGSIIAIRPGTYSEPQTLNKPQTFCTYDGSAEIR
jgi:endonuclease/exonuclease/phosphatase family metal-dependent hydrolase